MSDAPAPAPVVPGTVLLAGVVGYTAYGFAHAGSDVDRLGLYAAPTEELHGLHRPAESHVTTGPDVTLHEAAKWCRLALSCNPTASEPRLAAGRPVRDPHSARCRTGRDPLELPQ